MRSQDVLKLTNEFLFINRGYKDTAVLIPGWASDYRIFGSLDIRFNYVLPKKFSAFNFICDLNDYLYKQGTSKISLFGWSLGGFIASKFSKKYPDVVDRLILVSISKQYQREKIHEIKAYLARSKRAYLYKLYSQWLCGINESRWLKSDLFKSYCKELDTGELLRGLEYIEQAVLDPDDICHIKDISLIHGEEDLIAHMEEALAIQRRIPHAKFTRIEDRGHVPFLETDFRDLI